LFRSDFSFSSRRRHTRWPRDWSSDVCSSDLGDTSTNDTVLLLAGGASGVDPSRDGALWKTFEDAVLQVARTLALAIVSDGEGARSEERRAGKQASAGRAVPRCELKPYIETRN